MFSKILTLCALVAVGHAGAIYHHGHQSHGQAVSSQKIVQENIPNHHHQFEDHHHHHEEENVNPFSKTLPSEPSSLLSSTYRHSDDVLSPPPADVSDNLAVSIIRADVLPQMWQDICSDDGQTLLRNVDLRRRIKHNPAYYPKNAYPKYKFEYSVNDPKTKDQKQQWESRDGDKVEGQYSLLQPDGKTRTVSYTSDKHNGFQAQVETTGGDQYHHELQHFDNFQHQDALLQHNSIQHHF